MLQDILGIFIGLAIYGVILALFMYLTKHWTRY